MPPLGRRPLSRRAGFRRNTVTFVPFARLAFVEPLPRSQSARCSSSRTMVLPRGVTCANPFGSTVATKQTWAGKAVLICSWSAFGIGHSRTFSGHGAVEVDVYLVRLASERVAGQPGRSVAQRSAGPEVELPQVLQAGQDTTVVSSLGEGHRLVGAERLERKHLLTGVDHHDIGALDGELLDPVRGHLVDSTHALPGRARARGAGVDGSRRQVLLLDVDLVRPRDAGSVAEPLDRTT